MLGIGVGGPILLGFVWMILLFLFAAVVIYTLIVVLIVCLILFSLVLCLKVCAFAAWRRRVQSRSFSSLRVDHASKQPRALSVTA